MTISAKTKARLAREGILPGKPPKPPTSLWAKACKRQIYRTDLFGKRHLMEPGVVFFIEWIEKLGGTTSFSCEGHPRGFYIAFNGSYQLACRIAACGFLSVEVWADGQWRLAIGSEMHVAGAWTDENRRRVLSWAADSWQHAFEDVKE